jgi:hypothetical protein
MNSSNKNVWIVAAVALLAVIGTMSYLRSMTGEDEAPPVDSAHSETGAMPDGHPPVGTDGMPAASGEVAAVDPDAHFTHFRVGQRNVKTILPDGNVVWVGTSAGVIRYDTSTDDYRLFDTRTGLLANGVFHLSKMQGRLAVGTYGGGLSLLNDAEDGWKTYNIPEGLGDGFIYDALELDNGDIWIATWSGANRVRGGELDTRSNWDLYTVANTEGALPNDWVYALRAGKNGEVWFATEGGLARFKDEKWQPTVSARRTKWCASKSNSTWTRASTRSTTQGKRSRWASKLSTLLITRITSWRSKSITTVSCGVAPGAVACRALMVRTGIPTRLLTVCPAIMCSACMSIPTANSG